MGALECIDGAARLSGEERDGIRVESMRHRRRGFFYLFVGRMRRARGGGGLLMVYEEGEEGRDGVCRCVCIFC